jgi:hypothetical protein
MKHNLIKTDNYLLVVDENYNIVSGDYVVYPLQKRVPVQYLTGDLTGYEIKILSHAPLNGAPYLVGVDVLPRLNQDDEVDKLAEERFPVKNEAALDIIECLQIKQEVYAEGYNKAREKYEFTKEDMRKAIIMSSLSTVDFIPDRCDVIIQTIQQPKLPIAFECEMELVYYAANMPKEGEERPPYRPKTITNSEGRTEWVGKYIYE